MSIAHEATSRRRTVAPPTIREHRIPTAGSKPYIAVEGRDHCLWFCESGASKIGRLDPKTYTFKEFDLPTANATPIGIVVGPEGNLWFAEKSAVPTAGGAGRARSVLATGGGRAWPPTARPGRPFPPPGRRGRGRRHREGRGGRQFVQQRGPGKPARFHHLPGPRPRRSPVPP